MGAIASLVFVILYIAMFAVMFIATVRILNRRGYSGWWSLLMIVPVANIIGLWQLSKARWPGTEG